ncbi:hypothetical protein KJ912_04000 [Patescibacteria group bacterium]|nr:hypothetical protein [Patescibacteria group bacterium]
MLFRKLALIVDLVVFRFYLFFAGKRDLVIVCDRYFYDYLVNIFYLEDKKGAYIAPVLKSLIPKPDLALFLKISPKQADKRKKDQGLDYLDAKQKLYKKFGRRFGFKTIHSREKKTDTAKLIEKQWEKIKG